MIDIKGYIVVLSREMYRRSRALFLFTAMAILPSFLLIAPSPITALEVGRLSVYSELGRPLDVGIELSNVSPSEMATLAVRLAPPSEFQRLSIPYPENAGDLRFGVDTSPDGQPQVVIRSSRPMQSSFLHLLLQIDSSGGSILREYTALIDPPGSGTASRGTDTPAEQASAYEVVDSTVYDEQEAVTAPTMAAAYAEGEDQVFQGDSLSSVVERHLAPGVSRYQGWLAVYEANPHAFVGSDINLIVRGAKLRIPSSDEMRQISAAQAEARVKDLIAARRKTTDNIASSSTKPKPESSSAQPAPPVAVNQNAKPDTQPVASNAARQDAGSAQDIFALQRQMTDIGKDLTQSRKSREALDRRIVSLESQLQNLNTRLSAQEKNIQTLSAASRAASAADSNVSTVADPANDQKVVTSPEAGRAQLPQLDVDAKQEPMRNGDRGSGQSNAQQPPPPQTTAKAANKTDGSTAEKASEQRAESEENADAAADKDGNWNGSVVSTNQQGMPVVESPRSTRAIGNGGDWLPSLAKLLALLALMLLGLIGWRKFRDSRIAQSRSASREQALEQEIAREYASVSGENKPVDGLMDGDSGVYDLDGQDSVLRVSQDAPSSPSVSLDEGLDSELRLDDSYVEDISKRSNDTGVSSHFEEQISRQIADDTRASSVLTTMEEESRALERDSEILLSSIHDEADTLMFTSGEETAFTQETVISGVGLDPHTELTTEVAAQNTVQEATETTKASDEQGQVHTPMYSQNIAMDPIAEAEVYLAYDRKNQAIKVLKNAYQQNPSRQVIALKLLSVYRDLGDVDAFEALVSDIEQHRSADNVVLWEKVMLLADSFLPEARLRKFSRDNTADNLLADSTPDSVTGDSVVAATSPVAAGRVDDVEGESATVGDELLFSPDTTAAPKSLVRKEKEGDLPTTHVEASSSNLGAKMEQSAEVYQADPDPDLFTDVESRLIRKLEMERTIEAAHQTTAAVAKDALSSREPGGQRVEEHDDISQTLMEAESEIFQIDEDSDDESRQVYRLSEDDSESLDVLLTEVESVLDGEPLNTDDTTFSSLYLKDDERHTTVQVDAQSIRPHTQYTSIHRDDDPLTNVMSTMRTVHLDADSHSTLVSESAARSQLSTQESSVSMDSTDVDSRKTHRSAHTPAQAQVLKTESVVLGEDDLLHGYEIDGDSELIPLDEALVRRKRRLKDEMHSIDSMLDSVNVSMESGEKAVDSDNRASPSRVSLSEQKTHQENSKHGLDVSGYNNGVDDSDMDFSKPVYSETGSVVSELAVDSNLLDSRSQRVSRRGSYRTDSSVLNDSSQLEANQHEPDTSLALAKAYIELGEMEIARDFLKDVVRDGDGALASEAKKLLESLG